MNIKAFIFDMDGTLVDSLGFWAWFWARLGKRYLGIDNYAPDPAVDSAVRTMTYSDGMLYIRSSLGITGDLDEYVTYTKGELAYYYANVATVKEGAIRLLAHLKEAGVPMCLCSATDPEAIKHAIFNTGIGHYLEKVILCADVGRGKEHPDVYYLAERALGVPRENIAVVEDSPVALETAKAASFFTVGVYDSHSYSLDRVHAASDIYIDEEHDLTDLIGEIC